MIETYEAMGVEEVRERIIEYSVADAAAFVQERQALERRMRKIVFCEYGTQPIIYDDLKWCVNQLYVEDKDTSAIIPFHLKATQERFLNQIFYEGIMMMWRELNLPIYAILLKSRQWGGSTLISAFNYLNSWANERKDVRVINYDDDSAKNLYTMYERFWSNDGIKRQKKNVRMERQIVYEGDTGQIQVDSGYKKSLGKSFTLSMLHCSEVPEWRDPATALGALMPSVPKFAGGAIWIESTAKGHDVFKDLWDSPILYLNENPSSMRVFVGWLEDPDCSFKVDEAQSKHIVDTKDAEEERILSIGGTPGNLAFRRWKLSLPGFQGDTEKYKQEYPATPAEAFISSGRRFVDAAIMTRMWDEHQAWLEKRSPTTGRLRKDSFKRGEITICKKEENPQWYFGVFRPNQQGRWIEFGFGRNPNHCYLVSVDVAEGIETESTGKEHDNTAIGVWDYAVEHKITTDSGKEKVVEMMEQVACWTGKIDPEQLPYLVDYIARKYNWANVIIEANKDGRSVVQKLCGDLELRRKISKAIRKEEQGGFVKLQYPIGRVFRRRSFDEFHDSPGDLLGWLTTQTTRPIMLDAMRGVMFDKQILVHDEEALKELDSFIIDKNGKAVASPGKKDDRVFQIALGVIGMMRMPPVNLVSKALMSQMDRNLKTMKQIREGKPGDNVGGFVVCK